MRAWVLDSVERMVNALVEESTTARDRLAQLDGQSLGIHLTGLEIEFVMHAHAESLRIEQAPAASAMAGLSGTPLALLALLRDASKRELEGSGVSFDGSAHVLEGFVRFFDAARPDFEEELSRLTGDVVAHEVSRFAGRASNWASRALEALLLNSAEYLQEETRDLPARPEADAFFTEVERLRDDVARFLARAERAGVELVSGEPGSCGDSA
jgi:ubiquinone biosynthesis protein UbiJ